MAQQEPPKEPMDEPSVTTRGAASESPPLDEEWLRTHEDALRLRTELELMQLRAEDQIARINARLHEELLHKEEELERLRAHEELLRGRALVQGGAATSRQWLGVRAVTIGRT